MSLNRMEFIYRAVFNSIRLSQAKPSSLLQVVEKIEDFVCQVQYSAISKRWKMYQNTMTDTVLKFVGRLLRCACFKSARMYYALYPFTNSGANAASIKYKIELAVDNHSDFPLF